MGKTTVQRFPHPKYPRLYIQLRSNSRFFQAVTYVDGRLLQKSLKVEQLEAAYQLGLEWYRRVLRASEAQAKLHPLGTGRARVHFMTNADLRVPVQGCAGVQP